MRITEVTSRKHIKDFHKVPRILYSKDPYWVCPLQIEIERIFSPDANKLFRKGDARRWILQSQEGKLIGRIAAFHNKELAGINKQPTGGAGFFECINDREAAFLLFDTAKDWLSSQGMEAMDAPINFGGNNNHWGLLIDGFTHPGVGMPYNFPYYKDMFEAYGFRQYFQQYSYHVDITKKFPERFWKIAEWIARKPDFHYEHADLRNKEKYARDIAHIYNEAWGDFKDDFTPMEEADILENFERTKAIIDEELAWFVYYKDEPVAFFLFYPDVNQILSKLNGKLHLINKMRFFYYLRTRKITRVRAVVAGIVPKFRNSGIESAVLRHLVKPFSKRTWITEVELSWVGDFNPEMRTMYEAVGCELAKIHNTYRYLFNPDAPFERFMPDYMEKFKEHRKNDFQDGITYDANIERPKHNYLKYNTV